jgi:hypothetical protein
MKYLTEGIMHVTTSLDTAKCARRMADKEADGPNQEKVFSKLVPIIAGTRYGAEHGVDAGSDYQTFRRQVPFSSPETVQPYIDAMVQGAPDELWSGRSHTTFRTNGATTGTPRILPLTDAARDHFQRAAYQVALMHTAASGHAGVFHGRHLLLSESGSSESGDNDLASVLTANMPRWTEKHLFEPGQAIASIADRKTRIEKTATRAMSQDITLIAGTPSTLVEFIGEVIRQISQGGRSIRNLTDIWPNLECVVHTGGAATPHIEDLTQGLGKRVMLREVFTLSEAVVAAHDGSSDGALRLLDDVGVFFEFLPLSAKPDDHKQALPSSGVRPETDYELVVTTPSGLCRFRTDEVVRIVSTQPPRLTYRGRRSLALPLGTDTLLDRDLTEIMARVCRRHNWSIEAFHVNPLPAGKITRHEWWIELKPPCKETPISRIIEEELDEGLRSICPAYLEQREAHALDTPLVRLITPGVFGLCRKELGRENSEHAYPVCRPDRQVADQLMQYAGLQADQSPVIG